MRILIVVPLLLAGACSEGAETAKAEAPKVTAIQAGQWETTTEVTRLTQQDQGAPRIDTPAGTKLAGSVCITEADVKKPDPQLFVGSKDQCTYDNFYMSGGTVNAAMTCTREGLSGQIMTGVYGDYQADSFEATLDTSTHLATDGDVKIAAKVTGRHVGPCTAAAPEAAG